MAIEVIVVLAEIERGTCHKIADEIEAMTGFRRTPESIRRAITFLYREAALLEKCGRAKKPPTQRHGFGPQIWKLHQRLRYVA